MAECITSSSPSYCPQVKLVVTESTHDNISFTFAWTLSYVAHGYALSTDGAARSYTVKIDGELAKSGSRDINGVTGTIQLASGTYKVSKHSKARDVSFSCSFDFNATFSKVAMGTRTASGSYNIPATTSYTVSYYANEGSGAPSAQTKWHSVALTLSSTKPTRTGYTFVDWVATNGTHYNPGDSFTQNNNSTLTAQWKKITYSVTYNANGGSGAPSNQTKTYGTNLTLSSTKPTRTGYTFAGWNTNSSGTGTNYAAGATYTSNAALTLYAKWTLITYTVQYNANGGSGAPGNQTKNYGRTLTLSSTRPTRANYNFMGWATSSTGSVVYSPGSAYTGNAAITLYAIWELASQAPVISNLTIARKRRDGSDLVDDARDGDVALVDFDYSFDQSAGQNYADEIFYILSSKSGTVYLNKTEYGFGDKTSGHIQLEIESVTNLVDSTLYLTVVDDHGMSTTKKIRLYAGRYYQDCYDSDEGAVGVSVGMPASQPGFHVNPEATFHNHVHMKPDDPAGEGDIYFETAAGGQYNHKTSIYGASSDSLTALGAWDNKNGRRIWNYLDEDNILFFGDDPRIYRTAIPQNANLNDYLTPGHYVCGANTTVGTLSNLPSGLSKAFQMDVINTLSVTSKTSSYMKAVLTDYFGNQWINVKNGSWGGWQRIMWYNDLRSSVRPCLEYYVITNQKYSITTTLSLVATLTIGDSGKMKLISVNHAYTDKKPMEIAWGPGSSSNISGVTAAPSSGTPHPLQVIGMTTEDTIKIYAKAASAASNNISVYVVPLGN